MAKSTGNVVLFSDLKAKHIDPLALRLCFLENRYRSQMDLSWDSLKAAHLLLQRWRQRIQSWKSDKEVDHAAVQRFTDEIVADLRQDLDTPRALQKLRGIEKSEIISAASKYQIFIAADKVFGLDLDKQPYKNELPASLAQLLEQRVEARAAGNFTESDRLRDLLAESKVVVRDSKEGQSWDWLI